MPRRHALSGCWVLVTLAALFSLVSQNMLVETHLHPLSQSAAPARIGSAAGPSLSARKPFHHRSGDCALCREAASAGHFLPAVSPAAGDVLPLLFQPLSVIVATSCLLVSAFERCRDPPSSRVHR